MADDLSVYQELVENLHDGVYFLDPDRKITYWNKGAERLSGYSRTETIGRSCADNLLVHVDNKGVNLCQSECPAAKTLVDGQPREAGVYLRHKDGHRVPVLVRVAPVRDPDGKITGAVEVFSDNTPRAELAQRVEQLSKMAFFDPVTELANRRYAQINLQARIEETRRFGWRFGVLFLDIDRFKAVNDTYGHEVGDRVLRMVARTLGSNVRPFDLVARWGGEEFVATIANVDLDHLYVLADRLRALVAQSSLNTDPKGLAVTVSVGGTISKPEDTADSVIGRADGFMYESKLAGRNRVTIRAPD